MGASLRRPLTTALTTLVVAVAFFLGTMVAVAHLARPEPGPCNDTFIVPMRPSSIVPMQPSSICAAPQASNTLVLGAGAAAGLVAGAGVVVARHGSPFRASRRSFHGTGAS